MIGNSLKSISSDSAAYYQMVINYCDGYERGEKKRGKLYYTITGDQDVAVMGAVHKIHFTVWKQMVDEKGNAWNLIAETVHTMNETKEAFRLVIKRTQNKQTDLFEDYRYWIVSTNYPHNVKKMHEVHLHYRSWMLLTAGFLNPTYRSPGTTSPRNILREVTCENDGYPCLWQRKENLFSA